MSLQPVIGTISRREWSVSLQLHNSVTDYDLNLMQSQESVKMPQVIAQQTEYECRFPQELFDQSKIRDNSSSFSENLAGVT
jgi:hypothetical protein